MVHKGLVRLAEVASCFERLSARRATWRDVHLDPQAAVLMQEGVEPGDQEAVGGWLIASRL